MKASLNRAYEDGKVNSPEEWRRVKPFRGVEEPRVRYLDHEEARRLLNACEPDFRKLVKAAVYTGARYGELIVLSVKDYRPEAEAVIFHSTKAGKARNVYLTDEAVGLFDELTAGRNSRERMFFRSDGEPWLRSHQQRRMRHACEIAKIDPPLSFHDLRHTYASLYLMSGGSLVALAAQLGHADTRMTTRHYGHLADSWRAEEARKHGPTFLARKRNVERIDRSRKVK